MRSLLMRLPLINWRDLAVLATFPPLAVASLCVPPRYWRSLSLALAKAVYRFNPKWRARAAHMAAVVGNRVDALAVKEWPSANLAATLEKELMYFRCHWSKSWCPDTKLTGVEHLHSALQTGKGVVLWVAPFVFSDLVTKMTFRKSGFEVTHLSRFSHGYSATKFGVAVLNTIRTRIEARYLAERVVMGPEGPATGLRAWSDKLARGGLVSITLGYRGRRVHAMPMLDGEITVADGAVEQARRAGAILLPAFTVRDSGNCFVTHVGAPLPAHDTEGAEAETAMTIAAYVELLEGFASMHPEQWRWHQLRKA